jgi:hypothetical protein
VAGNVYAGQFSYSDSYDVLQERLRDCRVYGLSDKAYQDRCKAHAYDCDERLIDNEEADDQDDWEDEEEARASAEDDDDYEYTKECDENDEYWERDKMKDWADDVYYGAGYKVKKLKEYIEDKTAERAESEADWQSTKDAGIHEVCDWHCISEKGLSWLKDKADYVLDYITDDDDPDVSITRNKF